MNVCGMIDAGILNSCADKMCLRSSNDLPKDWDSKKDKRFTICNATYHMIRLLVKGEKITTKIMANLGSATKSAKVLTFRLYHTCEQKEYSQKTQDYDALIQSWPGISYLARNILLQQILSFKGTK